MSDRELLIQLQKKIIQWADEKGILEKATPEKQFLKFIEETGELARAILKQDSDEYIDSLGDIFVTIVIHAELCEKDLKIRSFRCLKNEGYDTRFRSMVNEVYLCRHYLAVEDIYNIYLLNRKLSLGKSFSQCVEVAYNVIADRTGEMKNGTFVKDS